MRRIIVNVMPTEKRVAVIENGKAVEFYIDRPDRGFRVGNIYKGKVVDVLPGLEAAFVDIGYEKKAFLHVDDCLDTSEEVGAKGKKSISRYVQEGQEILVQITKEAVGTKGARVTQKISLAGRYGVFLPLDSYLGISRRIQKESERQRLEQMAKELLSPTEGMIIRTLAEGVDEQSFVFDLHILRTRWENALEEGKHLNPPAILYQDEDMLTRLARDLLREGVDEMIVDHTGIRQQLQALLSTYRPELRDKIHYYSGKEGIFNYFSLEGELDKALNRKVWLKNGGYLIIDRTEAMTVIDVNTGKFTGTDDLQRTVVKTNKEACQEIARQLRLRDLAGIIIIDFIDMEKEEDRQEILTVMKNELYKDRTHTRIYGFTRLGLLELTRKRERQDLRNSLTRECTSCHGQGRILSLETLAIKLEREVLEYIRGSDFEAILVEIPPRMKSYLENETDIVRRINQEFSMSLYYKEHLGLREDQYRISFTGSKEEILRWLQG